MANDSSAGTAFVFYFFAFLGWFFFLSTTQLAGGVFANIIFWSLLGSIIGATGFRIYDARTAWGSLIVLLASILFWGIYTHINGYWMYKEPYWQQTMPENLLITGFFGVVGGIAIASAIGSAIGYFLFAKENFWPQETTRPKGIPTPTFGAVENDDSGFGFDPKAFEGKTITPSRYGYKPPSQPPRSKPRPVEKQESPFARKPQPKSVKPKPMTVEKNRSALDELNAMIGLEPVKKQILELRAKIEFDQKRKAQGKAATSQSMHMVFTGNAGTGKTTVARIVAQIFHELGVLKNPTVHEVARGDLVAQYIGQTEEKTREAIEQAMDGVLFIDEAYSLTESDSKRDFGREAVETILKEMEDNRDRLVVVAAGYKKEMQTFLNSNAGLKSRFKNVIDFPDYTPDEMFQIFEKIASGEDLKLAQDAKPALKKYLTKMYEKRDANFGNGRDVRNLFETCLSNLAMRAHAENLTDAESLSTITAADIPKQ